MFRSRGYALYIDKYTDYHWHMVENMQKYKGVEFLCASVSDNNEIYGFIRFNQNKTQSAVEKIFNNKVILKPVAYGNSTYKKELSTGKKYFEYDSRKPASQVPATDTSVELAKVIVETMAKQQSQFAEQIVELCKTVVLNHATNNSHNTTNNTNNNTNNNTTNNNTTNNNCFNLQFFLNEKCKDAFNMSEFVRTLPIGLDDIMYFKTHSHADSITRIIENALNGMEITKWPIHCTDLKRETLHVKEDDKWINDKTKQVTGKAIQAVASRSFKGINMWKNANPDYSESEELKTEYAVLVKNLLGANREEENKEKIIRNISRITHLDKDKITT